MRMLTEIDLKYHSLHETLELVSGKNWIENCIKNLKLKSLEVF